MPPQWRTNRRTRRPFRARGIPGGYETPLPLGRQPAEDVRVLGEQRRLRAPFGFGRRYRQPQVKPWLVEGRLQDGRKFNLRVMGLNQVEAAEQVRNKFPLVEIQTIRRADHPKLSTIGRAVGWFTEGI